MHMLKTWGWRWRQVMQHHMLSSTGCMSFVQSNFNRIKCTYMCILRYTPWLTMILFMGSNIYFWKMSEPGGNSVTFSRSWPCYAKLMLQASVPKSDELAFSFFGNFWVFFGMILIWLWIILNMFFQFMPLEECWDRVDEPQSCDKFCFECFEPPLSRVLWITDGIGIAA